MVSILNYVKFHETLLTEVEFFHVDMQTDRQTRLGSQSLLPNSFVNAPQRFFGVCQILLLSCSRSLNSSAVSKYN